MVRSAPKSTGGSGLENDGQISAKINGRIFPLNGKRNYLPLSPYGRYEVELQNSKNSLDSYDIVSGRKSHLTLYPGNVAVIEPEVKQMVTVSGRIRAEDGTLLANARINNHIGRTRWSCRTAKTHSTVTISSAVAKVI